MVKSETTHFSVHSPIAPKYERVHFVAHCRFGYVDLGALRNELLKQMWQIEEEIGYRVFLRDIKTKGMQPLWLDVDFILDLPSESPVAGWIIALIIMLLSALGIIGVLLIWWTIWHEESEIFVCDQCPEDDGYRTFKGRADYDAHLKLEHPEKWTYIEEQRDDAYWWLKLLDIMPTMILALLGLTLISYIPKPKREED